MITVVIPVVNPELANSLLANVEANSLKASQILIIDNTAEGYSPEADLPITVHRGPLSVNKSWQWGFSAASKEAELISVLNDDLIIMPNFFESILDAFRYEKCAVACPFTVTGDQPLALAPFGGCLPMQKREGWAFTIQKKILDKIRPIPQVLDTFCGDDWIWHETTLIHKMLWWKTFRTTVYHYCGVSVEKMIDREVFRTERQLYTKIARGKMEYD